MAKPQSSPPSSIRPSAMSWWAPRYWVGANFAGWTRELAVNRLAVSPTRAHMAVAGTIYSVFNSSLGVLENLIYRSRVAATPITHEPIFILGHWRCGTTLLHELLILDPEHASPNTWQCFAANHFLLSEQIGKKLLWFMLPAQRPMDNMPLGWDNPQEDEFALCNLGIPSPYLSILFPNAPPRYPQYLDLTGLSAEELDRWKGTLHRFLQRVSYRERKRLVLKSPPHTARVKTLLELFPDARFVHMVRDPEVLFASTMHLWRSLYESQGLQRPSFDGLEEHVFETFNRLHQKFQEERALIAPNRLCEMRYEDLVNSPLPQLEALYAQLELGDFNRARPRSSNTSTARRTTRPTATSWTTHGERRFASGGGTTSRHTATSGPGKAARAQSEIRRRCGSKSPSACARPPPSRARWCESRSTHDEIGLTHASSGECQTHRPIAER